MFYSRELEKKTSGVSLKEEPPDEYVTCRKYCGVIEGHELIKIVKERKRDRFTRNSYFW